MIKPALIVAIAIVIGGFLAGGRYTSTSTGSIAGFFVTDRFTGAAWACGQSIGCRKIENSD